MSALNMNLSRILRFSSTCRKEYRPCYQASDKTRDDRQSEKSQEEVAVERMMGEHVAVRNPVEFTDPTKQAVRHMWAALLWAETSEESTRLVVALELPTEDDEENKPDDGVESHRGENRQEGGDGRWVVLLSRPDI
jgi:hypothetical protein